MEQYILINAEYNLIVCLACRRTLTPDAGVIRHLRKHQVNGADLQEIKDFLNKINAPEKKANLHWTSVPHTSAGSRYAKFEIQLWMSGGCARYWTVGSQGLDAARDTDGDAGRKDKGAVWIYFWKTRTNGCGRATSNGGGQNRRNKALIMTIVSPRSWGKDRAVIAAATEWIRAKTIEGSMRQKQEEDADEKAQLIALCESVKRQVRVCLPRVYAVPSPVLQRLHGIEVDKSHSIPFRMNEYTGKLQKTALCGSDTSASAGAGFDSGGTKRRTGWGCSSRTSNGACYAT